MPKSSKMSAGAALDAALRAGKKSGDTADFDRWMQRAGLSDRGWFFRRKLRKEYESGVERGIDERTAKRARKTAATTARREKVKAAAERKAARPKKLGRRKRVAGYDVWQSEPGVWRSSLDRDSEFESYGDAARFTRSFAKGRGNPLCIPNPACGGTKPVRLITDRAKRYRANHPDCRPQGPKLCAFCASRRNVEVHHLDGNEDNGAPANLAWACRSCNTKIGVAHKKAGKGKRTRQFNPPADGRVPTYAQYARAVSLHVRGEHDEGGAIIHATPGDVRSRYARMIAAEKRKRGTHRRSEVPF